MIQENLSYHQSKKISDSWPEYFFFHASFDLAIEQESHEKRYLNAILGLSVDKKFFKDPVNSTRNKAGDRKKDLLYPFWNEEDLRLNLCRFLFNNKGGEAIPHGQVYLKKRYRKDKPEMYYPDIYFVIKKERERNHGATEKNVESGAIEIKFFESGLTYGNIRSSIISDLRKLISYTSPHFRPCADAGFFLCYDECGYANEILESLFKTRLYQKSKLAYTVITPQFVRDKTKYPQRYEILPAFEERKISFLHDFALGKLVLNFPKIYAKKRVRSSGGYHIHLNLGIGYNWISLTPRNESPFLRPTKYALMVKVDPLLHAQDSTCLLWDSPKNRYKFTIKNTKTRLYRKYPVRSFRSIHGIRKIANDMVKIAKRIQNKAAL